MIALYILHPFTPPPPLTTLWLVYAFLRGPIRRVETPSNPFSCDPTNKVFPPLREGGKRWPKWRRGGSGRGWRRCHCTALGEGHYSEQGEPVTSAPTPGIDPTPSTLVPCTTNRGCNAPYISLLLYLHGTCVYRQRARVTVTILPISKNSFDFSNIILKSMGRGYVDGMKREVSK